MVAINLSPSTHSLNANRTKSQAAPAFFVINQSNHVSIQDILFGVLTIILAIASVLLAYLQLVHMRNQARSSKPDVEMFSVRKHTLPTSYITSTPLTIS